MRRQDAISHNLRQRRAAQADRKGQIAGGGRYLRGNTRQGDGGIEALVDGGGEQQQGQAIGKSLPVNRLPVVALVEFGGVFEGQGGNVQVRIGALGNAVFRLTPRISGVIGVAAFFGEDEVNAAVEVAHVGLSGNNGRGFDGK